MLSIHLDGVSGKVYTIHTEYPFECYILQGIYYPSKVSISMLDLARCQLSTYSIHLDARSRKVSTIHVEYPFGRYL